MSKDSRFGPTNLPGVGGGVALPPKVGGGPVTTTIGGEGLPINDRISSGDVSIELPFVYPTTPNIEKYLKGISMHIGPASNGLVPITVNVPEDRKAEWELFFALCLTMMQAREQPK